MTESFIGTRHKRDSMRIVLVVREQALRIASAVVRAHDFADRVTILNLAGDVETAKLGRTAGAEVIEHDGPTDAPSIAKTLISTSEESERTVIISLDSEWKLSDMARTVGLSRQGHDVFIAFKHRTMNPGIAEHRPDTPIDSDTYTYEDAVIQFAYCSMTGLKAVSEQSTISSPAELDGSIDLRIVELDLPAGPPRRESLASASRFAQFFYWMLESKHPLILFGVPGVVFFWVGFEMATELINFQGPHDSVSIGVALAAFAATLVGVFSLTTSLILYVLGKQVNRMPNRASLK
ncbi:MAG: hypothetical protein CND85_04980 [Marine Group II euryarchaeote MED-G33]|nr:MAG: hypothetical protein CND85_04980 [Marine Group II euryarchaeote MED-G33]